MTALLAGLSSARAHGPTASLYERLANLNAQLRDRTGAERGDAIVREYRNALRDEAPCSGASSVSHTLDLFKATAFAELYSLDEADVEVLGCLYAQLRKEGIVDKWHAQTYFGALVSVSRYADADTLTRRFGLPRLPLLQSPQKIPAKSARMILVEDATSARVEAWTPAPATPHVVMVVHPACAFSRSALQQITTDRRLGWLKERLLLLVPPDASLPLEGLLAWNADHPGLPMHLMYKRADWDMLRSLDTPTFYLMSDNKVLETFEGWPNERGLVDMRKRITH